MTAEKARLPIYDSTALRIPIIHELIELVRYRYLLWNLIARDLKVRYKRSLLGFLWAMLNPLLTMVVLLVVFSTIFQPRVENFPIYLLAGILLWNLFGDGTRIAMSSLLGNSQFLTKIYVPPSVFVASSVGSALVNFFYALGPLLILTLLVGLPPRASWLFLVVPMLQTTILTFGIGLAVASLMVFFLDIRDIYTVFLRAYFYLTPIVYPSSILSPRMALFQKFNPMNYLVSSFRTALIDGRLPPANEILIASIVSLGALVLGWAVFTRLVALFAYRA